MLRFQISWKRAAWKLAVAAVSVFVVILIVSWFAFPAPLVRSCEYPGGAVIRDSSGDILRVSLGPEDVDCRPYYRANRDDWIVKALVAAEDKRFYSHCGVDFRALMRAISQNFFSFRRISGASTISMQTVRLITPHPRTLPWKYAEMFQTIRLELAMSKDEILSQYLNRAPFGSNLVGIEAASAGWFNKSPHDLGLGEAALLAGMVQSPTRFRPDRNLARALKRREYVLDRMLDLGFITDAQYESSRSSPVRICRAPRPFSEPFFCDWAVASAGLYSGDFVTTLDMDIQNPVKRLVSEHSASGGYSVAAVVMRAKTGEVVAMDCSGDYFSRDAGQVNTATTPRPAGSTLKPFLLAFAMDRGLVIPSEILADIPRSYSWYKPMNFVPVFRGLVSASDALILSLNLPFIDMVSKVGVPRFTTLLRALGFSHINRPDSEYGLGIITGNASVSLIELTSAYACIARGGSKIPPVALLSGNQSEDSENLPKLFSPGACYLVSKILSGYERSATSFGHVADVKLPKFAWKTGTSSAFRDAWTIAWNPDYVIGVWCGHKSGKFGDSSLVGADAAAPLVWKIARGLYPTGDSPWFRIPSEIISTKVCSVSGLPVSPDCTDTIFAEIIKGRSSSGLCTVHRRDPHGNIVTKWPSDVENFMNVGTNSPSITIKTPSDGDVYTIVPGMEGQGVVCRASLPGGGHVWWFVDSVLLGQCDASDPLVFKPKVGPHRITCCTAFGKTAVVDITVEEL